MDSAKQNFSVNGISDKVQVSFTFTNSKSGKDFHVVAKFIRRILTVVLIPFFDDNFSLYGLQ